MSDEGLGDAADALDAIRQRRRWRCPRGVPAALVERFDREPGAEYGRRHYMSAQTLLAARRSESRFYTDIADGLRVVCRTETEALAEMAELHLRIGFTILVSNNDDHLKNHDLLYAGEGSCARAGIRHQSAAFSSPRAQDRHQ